MMEGIYSISTIIIINDEIVVQEENDQSTKGSIVSIHRGRASRSTH